MALNYNECENRAHSSVCYIQVRNPNGIAFIPVESAKTFRNVYGLDLFQITKDVYSEDGKRILSTAGSVTDGMTGIKLCNRDEFENCISSRGIDTVKNLISSMVEKYGWSPRYLRPEEKKNDVFSKEEKDAGDKCILATPLFDDGMFNCAGKRMRVKFLKTVESDDVSYDLYISGSKTPDRDYPQSEDDKFYLHVMLNGWLVPLNITERYLRQNAVRNEIVTRLYGDEDGRDKLFDSLRDDRSYEEAERLVKEQLRKEEALEEELSKDGKYIAAFIKFVLKQHVQNYTACKNGIGRFPDFIGAVIMDDVENCIRLSEIRKQRDAEEQKERNRQAEEKAREKAKAEAEREAAEIAAAEEIMLNGGKITDGNLLCVLADKYNVTIPLRTRGWILNTFASCEISESNISVRFWKTKNGSGSTKIYEIIGSIRAAVTEASIK